jgi:hypothetical protein
MKRASIAVAVLVALTLTGCAGTPDNAGDERTAPGTSESAAPLVAETSSAPAEDLSDDELFLSRVREELPENTVIPDASDEQLLAAAQQACEQMNSGTDVAAVQVIEGEQPNGLDIYESSAKIAAVAKDIYCPQGY